MIVLLALGLSVLIFILALLWILCLRFMDFLLFQQILSEFAKP